MKMDREQTTIHLPADLKEQIQRQAEERGYTIRDLIVFILWDHVRLTIPPE